MKSRTQSPLSLEARTIGAVVTSFCSALGALSIVAFSALPTLIIAALAFPTLCLAQEGSMPIKVTSSVVPNVDTDDNGIGARSDREKSAPQVMAPPVVAPQSQAVAALQAAQARDLELFNESVKRLQDAETTNPAYALDQYRQFLVGRQISSNVGVQVALKVSQMRQKMGDSQGALLTCDVLSEKYASEPSVALLSLQKARVLMDQEKLVEASQCVHEALPNLLVLGAGHYAEVSGFLLQLAQINLNVDKQDIASGKKRAETLCIDIEEIYLRWIKKDTVDHLWQRFEALQAVYQQVGNEQRAKELLRKVGDVLLEMPSTANNGETPVLYLELARSLTQEGQSEQAAIFYKRIPQFHDGYHTILARYDQARPLIDSGKLVEAEALLASPLDAVTRQQDGQIAQNTWMAMVAYQQGHLDEALNYGQKVEEVGRSGQSIGGSVKNLYDLGKDIYLRAGGWKTQPIQCDVKEITLKTNPSYPDRPLYARFRIKTYGHSSVLATVDNPAIQVRVLPVDNWWPDALNSQEQEMEVVIRASTQQPAANVPLVLSNVALGWTTIIRLTIIGERSQTAFQTTAATSTSSLLQRNTHS